MATRQEIRESEQSMSSMLLEVIGPALIMLMVGSLVFFLIEVFYRGPHTARLCWVFGLFTFASVLVSRVSIESGKERGRVFGFALALAAFVTSFTLVDFEGDFGAIMEPVFLIVFICVVMWSAAKLTWDCTVIDKSRDISATGITELVRRRFRANDEGAAATDAPSDDEDSQVSSDAQAGNLIRAFFRSGERKNTPGIWVFYFSMAALPIFGIGQWFVKANPQGGYGWVVLLFGIYLAAGLGLMMTTSLLGLQRYLKKRKTHMPPEIARTWLGIGTAAAMIVLAFVLVFPRPNASKALEQGLSWFTSPIKKSSELAQGDDGTEEKDRGKGSKSSEDGKQASSDAKTDKTSGDSKDGRKTQSGGNDGQDSNSDSKSDKQDGQKSDGEKSDGQKSEGSKGENESESGRDGQEKSDEQNGEKNRNEGSNERKTNDQAAKNSRGSNAQLPKNNHSTNTPRSLQGVSKFATWITYLIAAVAAIVLLWMFRKEVSATIKSLIAELKNLFGQKKKEEQAEDSSSTTASAPIARPRPFAQFQNPFLSGAGRMTPEKIVEYTFRALESWSFERGIVRSEDQTPHEFAARLADLDSKVGQSAVGLSNLFCKNLFGQRKIGPDELEPLKDLWQLMQNTDSNSSTQIAFAN